MAEALGAALGTTSKFWSSLSKRHAEYRAFLK
jgi:hypothetical protein